MNGEEAPNNRTVPMQRDAPPLNLQRANPPPATAARDGHHDWGAVVAVLAALIVLMALAALIGPGSTSVSDSDIGSTAVGINR